MMLWAVFRGILVEDFGCVVDLERELRALELEAQVEEEGCLQRRFFDLFGTGGVALRLFEGFLTSTP